MGSTEPFPKPLTFTLTFSSHHSRGRWAGLGISPCLQITMLLAWGHTARCMAESGLKPGSPEAHVDIFQNTSLLISLIPKILLKKKKKKDLQRSPVPLNPCLRFLGPRSPSRCRILCTPPPSPFTGSHSTGDTACRREGGTAARMGLTFQSLL